MRQAKGKSKINTESAIEINGIRLRLTCNEYDKYTLSISGNSVDNKPFEATTEIDGHGLRRLVAAIIGAIP